VSQQVVISSVSHTDDRLRGQVVNQTGKTIYDAKVKYEIMAADGSVIDRGEIYTQQQKLSPGQSATFEMFIPSRNQVRVISVEWH
jgi:hypothetical protein